MKGAFIAALTLWLAYNSIQLTEARHELRQLQLAEDISDTGVGADMDGAGDWQEVSK